MADNVYTSNYSGKQIDDGIAAIPQLEKRIGDIEKNIAGEGDEGIGNTIGTLNTRISNNTDAILEIKENLLPSKVNLSDYNSRVGSAETQISNLNTNVGTLQGAVGQKADSSTLTTTKNNLQDSINRLDAAYKAADTQLDTKIDEIETGLTAQIDEISNMVTSQGITIEEMREKVNSAPTDANFSAINNSIDALRENKADKTELTEINNKISLNINSISTNTTNISNNTTSIQNLSDNKLDISAFEALNNRVAELEEDTTMEGLTTKIGELQEQIREILTDIEAIKGRLDTLETPSASE